MAPRIPTSQIASSNSDPKGDPLIGYEWDLNADGSFDDLSGVKPNIGAADSLARFGSTPAVSYSIAVKVTDAFGASAIRYTTLNVTAVPAPAAASLMLAGLLAMCARTKRGSYGKRS